MSKGTSIRRMQINLLSASQVEEYENALHDLMRICLDASFASHISDGFIAEKLAALKGYLEAGKAYLFAAFHEEQMLGFLWGCRLESITGPVFHVLYFAVYPQYRAQGIGRALLHAAEEKAADDGIPEMELLVSVLNGAAKAFYVNHDYGVTRYTMRKTIKGKRLP